MNELTICHLYPDLMNLYGDRGNVLALTRRSEWRGIQVKTVMVSLNDAFDASSYDIVFIGGGQDYEQSILQQDLMTGKKEAIIRAIEDDVVFLAICGGYQLLGSHYQTHEGQKIDCIGALDLWTQGGKKRMIGNLVFDCPELTDSRIVGFENHSGKTYHGKSIKPLGKVLFGNGNNGEDSCEGARYRNVFCSYSHGSLLPKNPALTDHLLTLALKRKYADFTTLAPLDDHFEQAARTSLLKRFLG
jgi:CobQ-like glutamine amidotransferase family enzyme